jgi:hypothetical protein
MGGERRSDGVVGKRRQATPGNQLRIQIPHRAGRDISRVGVQRFAGLLALLVDALEVGAWQVYLATYFDGSRRSVAQR